MEGIYEGDECIKEITIQNYLTRVIKTQKDPTAGKNFDMPKVPSPTKRADLNNKKIAQTNMPDLDTIGVSPNKKRVSTYGKYDDWNSKVPFK